MTSKEIGVSFENTHISKKYKKISNNRYMYHCDLDLITNEKLNDEEKAIITELIKEIINGKGIVPTLTTKNLLKMCEDYQYEIAKLKRALNDKNTKDASISILTSIQLK